MISREAIKNVRYNLQLERRLLTSPYVEIPEALKESVAEYDRQIEILNLLLDVDDEDLKRPSGRCL